jgi:hypothetical protein
MGSGMKLSIKNQKEFGAGVIFAAIGLCWAIDAVTYPMGRATDMGPGYFPFVVALILLGLGIASILRAVSVADVERLESWRVAPLLFVLAGIGLFAAFIESSGLILASICLVVVSSFKNLLARPVEVALLAAGTAVFVVVVFIFALHLNMTMY